MSKSRKSKKPDIIKAGAIIFDDLGRLLITRSKGKDFWIFLGGTLDPGETLIGCLIREVQEEINVNVLGEPRFYFQSPIEPAIGKPGKTVQISAYFVDIDDVPQASSEVEEIYWLSKSEFLAQKLTLGSVLNDFVIPKLIEDGLLK